MSHIAYPNFTDLGQFLATTGVIASPPTALDALSRYVSYCQSASAEWERRTGWMPFLPDSVDQTRNYDPPGPPYRSGGATGWRGGNKLLFLDGGLLSLTSLTTQVTATSPGVVQTQNTQFFLQPTNALAKGQPYEWIEFATPQFGTINSIVLVGKFGYATTIPMDAWQAILMRAAVMATLGASSLLSSGMVAVSIGENYKYQFSTGTNGPFTQQMQMWQKQFEDTVSRFRRIDIGRG